MSRPGWPVVSAMVVAAGMAILYGGVAVKLVRDWAADENYSHGFLIVPIALYLAWERRHRLRAEAPRPVAAGLALVLLSIGVLAAGTLGAELFLQRISLLGVLAGTIVFVGGWQHVRILSFPLAFLLLMIPIPAILFNQVAFPLQLLASRFGETALLAAGIPVLREGNVITLANVTLEVAEACSGIRSLISLLTLAIVYGYFVEPRPWARVALALASIPVAIVANGLRVAGTGIAAHYYGAEAAHGFLHTFSGWLVFVAAFVLLFAVQRALALVGRRPGRSAEAGELRPNEGHAAPSRQLPSPLLRSAIVCACLVLGAVAIARASGTEPVLPRRSFDQFPMDVGSWHGESTDRFDQRTMTVLGVDEYVNRIYAAPGEAPAGLYIGFYRSQRQGDTIHSPLNCLPGAGWEPVRTARVPIDVPTSNAPSATTRRILVNQVVIQKGLDRQVVLYWYQSHGRVTASEYWGKIYTVLDAIRLNRTDAAMVRVITPVVDNSQAAQAAAERSALTFVRAVFPLLGDYLPE